MKRSGFGRVGGLAIAMGAGAWLASSPLAHADGYDLQTLGPGTVVSDTGIPGLFENEQITQEIAEYDLNGTTSVVATGPQEGSLDVTEHIFTSPLGSVGFIDGSDATDGTGLYAADAGNPNYYDLVFEGPFGGVHEYGNIPLAQLDFELFPNAVSDAAAVVPADDFGLSSVGLEGLTPGLESLINLF